MDVLMYFFSWGKDFLLHINLEHCAEEESGLYVGECTHFVQLTPENKLLDDGNSYKENSII